MSIITKNAVFDIDPYTEDEVVEMTLHRTGPLTPGRAHLVVTPNMHHLAMLEHAKKLGTAYQRATLRLADGWPVVNLARRLGEPVTQRTTGSGIVEKLAAADGEGRRLFIIGGSSAEFAKRAADFFAGTGWVTAYNGAPKKVFRSASTRRELVDEVAAFGPDVVLIALGAPKQEYVGLDLLEHEDMHAVILCIGAGLTFLLDDEVTRAPEWMRRANLEFAHRILQEPTRLLGRYIRDVPPFLRVHRRSMLSYLRSLP